MRYFKAALFALLLAPVAAQADDKVKDTAGNAAKTGVDAVVDSARTVGRTTKAAVKGGTPAAKATWKANADTTKRDAHYNSEATRAAAHRSE
jgi:hypothetical protein